MSPLSVPRQPFVGLALIASIGIILADFLPLSSLVLLWLLVAGAIGVMIWPSSILTHALVGIGFFWLHSFHLQKLARISARRAIGRCSAAN